MANLTIISGNSIAWFFLCFLRAFYQCNCFDFFPVKIQEALRSPSIAHFLNLGFEGRLATPANATNCVLCVNDLSTFLLKPRVQFRNSVCKFSPNSCANGVKMMRKFDDFFPKLFSVFRGQKKQIVTDFIKIDWQLTFIGRGFIAFS